MSFGIHSMRCSKNSGLSAAMSSSTVHVSEHSAREIAHSDKTQFMRPLQLPTSWKLGGHRSKMQSCHGSVATCSALLVKQCIDSPMENLTTMHREKKITHADPPTPPPTHLFTLAFIAVRMFMWLGSEVAAAIDLLNLVFGRTLSRRQESSPKRSVSCKAAR